MGTNEITVVVNQSGIEPTKAQIYGKLFTPYAMKVRELDEQTSLISIENPTVEDSKKARELRLAYSRNRNDADRVRKSAKNDLLNETGLIQALYNVIDKESKLQESKLEKVEKYQELLEKQRREELGAKRSSELSHYVFSVEYFDLANMPEETYQTLLKNSISAFEARIANEKKEAAERAEIEQKEADERERVRLENVKLREENEKALEKQRELQKKLREQEAEKKRLAAIEEKKIADAKEAERQALLAPDKEKVKAWAQQILSIQKPALVDPVLAQKVENTLQKIEFLLTNLC